MGAKGSALSRAIRFFKEADVEEAQYVLGRAGLIVAERTGGKSKMTIATTRRKKPARKPVVAEQPNDQSAA